MFFYHVWPPMPPYPGSDPTEGEWSEALKHLKDVRLEALSEQDEEAPEYE